MLIRLFMVKDLQANLWVIYKNRLYQIKSVDHYPAASYTWLELMNEHHPYARSRPVIILQHATMEVHLPLV